MNFESQVVHIGDRKRRKGVPVPSTTPIHLSTTYFYDSAVTLDRVMGHEEEGFSYARYANPTNHALEELTTALERGHGSLATASGMAAVQIALQAALTDRPHTILASDSIYGASVNLLDQVFGVFDTKVKYIDVCNFDLVKKTVEQVQPGCIFLESISNPLLRVSQMDKIAELARQAGAALVVDNTFAGGMLCHPLDLGANIVIHSATKYLAGHGDVLGGVVVSDEAHFETVRSLARITGPTLGPFESYLTMRGIKTLALRFERQCQNAKALAEWLGQHPCVDRVYYCADPSHPDAAAIRQFFHPGLFGAILSFEIKNADKSAVLAFMDRLGMVVPGTSLGDVHTLLLYPLMASHRNISPKMRERMGIRENLVRVAAGIEHIDDIKADLDRALRLTAADNPVEKETVQVD
ncbi:MAG: PLP-dependent transferase [Acidobacteriaceae bacterium]|nr:PLP-dependent transferase [Acidobacteriaceae bacterium]MBV9224858.1 PLP-dependent transferase [Acidobacteriaceae bacterium]MBV9308442.1 PLP-dependent transferase [Acidobacteriaceae bacterium]